MLNEGLHPANPCTGEFMPSCVRPALTASTLVAIILTTVGCGSSKSPTAPSTSTAGAVITGTVRSGAAAVQANTGAAGQGVTVSVAGTDVRSGIDAAGRFSLTGVPAGDVQLKFTGTNVDATLPLTQVQPTQTIELVVNLAATFATVESEQRSGDGGVQIEGRVESLPPTLPDKTFKVAGLVVLTDDNTRFERGGDGEQFEDLAIGMRVHVVARQTGSTYLATEVRIQNTNTWIPVNVNGIISDLEGDATGFQFKIGGRVIKGDVLTEFFGDGSDADTFDSLEDGVRVEVKGQQGDDFVYAARIHVNDGDDDDNDDGDQDSSASIHGELKSLGGTPPPNMTLLVGDTTVRTDGSTEVQRRGDVQTLEVLQVGMTLHVVGDRQSDGSIDARRIFITDDEVGDPMEIEGSAGGVQGSCPTLTFGVNGFTVKTNASTTFEGKTCSDLKSGTRVKVNGTRQADGSILATRVES